MLGGDFSPQVLQYVQNVGLGFAKHVAFSKTSKVGMFPDRAFEVSKEKMAPGRGLEKAQRSDCLKKLQGFLLESYGNRNLECLWEGYKPR